ncbi:MAG: glycosyltransferase family 4 protein, partial [Symploca sp. SIO2D2]|nr:glycosyltransferase family 4 protein [Symploca sp. SIO2D2]
MSRKLKICIVQGAFFPVPPIMGGAVEKIWYELGKRFVQMGHEVQQVSRAVPEHPRNNQIEGVQHNRVAGYDTPSNLLVLKLLDLRYTLRAMRAAKPADIIVTNTFWFPILRRHNRKGKLYVHVARFPKGQLRLYKHSARIQSVSTAVQDEAARQAPELEPIMRVVPNPVDLPTDASIHSADAQTERTLLYTGRIHPEKGLDLLLKAFVSADMPGWTLRIVGPWKTDQGGGGQGYLDRLSSIAQSGSAKVDFVEPIFDKEKLALEYEKADLFCYPSLADKGESFGVSPLEAMAHGAPAI